jgi:hypothetical protein
MMSRNFILLAAATIVSISAVLFGVTPGYAVGTTYYVSPSGSDSAAGTATGTAFKTVQRCAAVAVAGDTCSILSGTYHETVTPAHSGTSAAPITFSAAAGVTATVDGADTITSTWSTVTSANLATLVSADSKLSSSPFASAVGTGDVYQTTVTLPGTLSNDQLFVDGVMATQAQWPNPGADVSRPVLGRPQSETNTSLSDTALTQPAGYWTGASVWTHHWFISETGTVSSSSVGAVTLANLPQPDCAGLNTSWDGTTYHFYGNLESFSAARQWLYNTASKTLYLWLPSGDTPASHSFAAKTRALSFDLTNASYITISGLHTLSSTITTGAASNGVIIDSLDAKYLSHYTDLTVPSGLDPVAGNNCGVLAYGETTSGIQLKGTGDVIRNSTIAYSAGNGVYLGGSGNTAANNYIHNVDYAGSYAAGVNFTGSNQLVQNNTIFTTGRSGITVDWFINGLNSTNNRVDYNNVYGSSQLSSDSGVIYDCCSLDLSGTRIDHNWLHDDVTGKNTWGVHMDNSSNNAQIDHNVSWGMSDGGVIVNGGSGNVAVNNTWQFAKLLSGGNTLKNEISTGGDSVGSGNTTSNNNNGVPSSHFTDPASNDYRLIAGSAEIDSGLVVSGITTGAVGSAPDLGAYESGGYDWIAGCAMAICTVGTTVHGLTTASQYEAESGTVTGTTIETDHPAYSGTGFVVTNNAASVISERITAPATRSYMLRTRYSNAYGSADTRSYYIDGVKLAAVAFPSTISWNEWGVVDTPVSLTAGTHTLTVKLDSGDTGSVNIDLFDLGTAPSVVQAESGTLSGGAVAATDHTGYRGAGFVAFTASGSRDDLSLTSDAAGTYSLTLRFANGNYPSAETKTLSEYVNGTRIGQASFPSTADWNTWSTVTMPVTLTAGSNTLSLEWNSGDTGWVNVDQIAISPATVQAESGSLAGSATVNTNHSGYLGTGFVSLLGSTGGDTLTMNAIAAGSHSLVLRYANGNYPSGETKTLTAYVNGIRIGQVSFPGTTDWDTWSTVVVPAALTAGANTVTFEVDSGDTGWLNLDQAFIN